MLRYLILGVLRDGTARHGYAIVKEYRSASGAGISVGNFYREIRRLLVEGLVRVVANPVGADPRRVPYEITPPGREAFDAWLDASLACATTTYQDELGLRAYLIVCARGRLTLERLDRWRAELGIRRQVARLALEATVTPGMTLGDADALGLRGLLLARRLHQASADVEFVEQFERAYRSWIQHGSAHREVSRTGAGLGAKAMVME